MVGIDGIVGSECSDLCREASETMFSIRPQPRAEGRRQRTCRIQHTQTTGRYLTPGRVVIAMTQACDDGKAIAEVRF